MHTSQPVGIVVLAHNEERRIGRCLSSLPIGEDGFAVHVVVNGTNDRTSEIASIFQGIKIHNWKKGGKSRSWNRIIFDTAGIEYRHYVFVDGDTEVLPGSINALVAALDRPGVNATSALPANGRSAASYRQQIILGHGMFGDLYALSGDFIARMRGKGLRLPDDLIGDDGLLGALAKTDLGYESDWRNDRVQPVPEARFLCDPITLTPSKLALQRRRMCNYSLRHFQNRIITDIMRSEGPDGLPKLLASLYPRYMSEFRPRSSPKLWWFDRQALKEMGGAQGKSPSRMRGKARFHPDLVG